MSWPFEPEHEAEVPVSPLRQTADRGGDEWGERWETRRGGRSSDEEEENEECGGGGGGGGEAKGQGGRWSEEGKMEEGRGSTKRRRGSGAVELIQRIRQHPKGHRRTYPKLPWWPIALVGTINHHTVPRSPEQMCVVMALVPLCSALELVVCFSAT